MNGNKIARVEEFVSVVKTVFEENGGSESFFQEMADNSIGIIAKVPANLRSLLKRSIEDREFRSLLISHVQKDSDREFLKDFLDDLEFWLDISPGEREFINSALNTNARGILSGPVPQFANYITSSVSAISLDIFVEDFIIKAAVSFAWADKSLGDSETLVISGRLSRYIDGVRNLLNGASLRESEIALLQISRDRDIVDKILSALDNRAVTVSEIRSGYEKVKGPSRS